MIKDKYQENYDQYCIDTYGETKYEWCASVIFDLFTYDEELDEIFVKNILEVLKIIIDRCTFEYIKDQEKYIKYIIVCNMLDKLKWIEWGTSIRGAWINKHSDVNIISGVPVTEENIKALIDFMEE